MKNFIKKIRSLGELDNCFIFDKKGLFDTLTLDRCENEVLQSHVREFLGQNGEINKDIIKNQPCYHYGYLNLDIQDRLLEKIEELSKEEFGNNQNFGKGVSTFFGVLFNINKDILNILQNFDFAYQIPKIIYFHNDNFSLNHADELTLRFMNRLGVDIVAITPPRYCDIENIFPESILQTFQLNGNAQKMKNPFKTQKEEKGIFSRLLNL